MVDIIIPVYNGFDVIGACMDSVIKHTDLENNRVILVNDCSPNERILPLLESYCKNKKNIILIDSKNNEGFSASVNKGIMYSDSNDVLLLNSDTIVTKNWLEKIKACAYSRLEISTVTPLSNAATLCSVPEFCKDNDLPENFTIDEFAELVEEKSLHKYPEITVAVGFCMFIKRKVINKIGLFDAETFGKGYGEENDFCNRAQQLGYVDVMCDDTFIYHSGSASFISEQKNALCAEHDKILRERYPKQMQKNDLYCVNNPDKDVRDNLKIYMPLHNGKKNLLFLSHYGFNQYYSDIRGGVQYHVKDLVDNFRNEYNVFFAARNGNYLTLSYFADSEECYFDFPIFEHDLFERKTDKNLKDLWISILKSFDINLIHIHHTILLSDDIFYAAQFLDIPYVLTVHDFFYLCPNYTLLDANGDFCHYDEGGEKCNECLRKNLEIYENLDYKNMWQEKNEMVFKNSKFVIFPSAYVKSVFEKRYNLDNAIVIEHGSDPFMKDEISEAIQFETDSNVKSNVDYCGIERNNIFSINGWAFWENEDSANIDVYLQFTTKDGKKYARKTKKIMRDDVSLYFGEKYRECGFSLVIALGDKDFPADEEIECQILLKNRSTKKYCLSKEKFSLKVPSLKKTKNSLRFAFVGNFSKIKGSEIACSLINATKNMDVVWYCIGATDSKELSESNNDNFVLYGDYEREKLPEILDSLGIDAACILPIWGETFCYTLSEVLLCRRPVIATDIGAVGERVKKYDCGWIVSVENAANEIVSLVNSLLSDRKILEDERKKVLDLKLKSVKDMCLEYKDIYLKTAKNMTGGGLFTTLRQPTQREFFMRIAKCKSGGMNKKRISCRRVLPVWSVRLKKREMLFRHILPI